MDAELEDLKRLAKQGNAQAQCDLGTSYFSSIKVPIDKNESIKLWRRSAEHGNNSVNVNWVKYMLLAWVYLSTRLNLLTGSRDQLNKVFMKLSEKNLLNFIELVR